MKNFLPAYTKLQATFSKGNISLGDLGYVFASVYLVYRLYFQKVLKERCGFGP